MMRILTAAIEFDMRASVRMIDEYFVNEIEKRKEHKRVESDGPVCMMAVFGGECASQDGRMWESYIRRTDFGYR